MTTYGLPFDIISTYAEENNMSVDKQGFETKIAEHKEKSKNMSCSNKSGNTDLILKLLGDVTETEFVGYEQTQCESEILKIVVGDKECSNANVG